MPSPGLFSQGFSVSPGVTDLTFSPTLSAHAAGDMIELDVVADGNIGISITGGSGGWTKLWELQNTVGSATPTHAKFKKLAASAAEAIDLTGTAGEAWAASCRVVRGSGGVLNFYSPTPVNGVDSGSGADGQGGPVNPGVGTQDFLFTTCMGMDGVQGTNAAPTGYGNYQTNNNATAARVDISTAEKAATATGDTPGPWDSNAEQWTVGGGAHWETSSGPAGTLSKTLDDVTVSATGQAPASGTLARTLDAVALSASGSVPVAGSASVQLGAMTLTAQAVAAVAGGLARTLDAVALSAIGTVGSTSVAGTLARTLDAMTLTGTASAPAAASLARTLDAVALSASGSVPVAAGAAVTLGAVTLAAAGAAPAWGALGRTLDAVALTGAGTVGATPILGGLAVQLGAMTLTAQAAARVAGTLARPLDGMILASGGAVAAQGGASIQLDAIGLAASGSVSTPVAGGLAVTLGAVLLAATGVVTSGPYIPTRARLVRVGPDDRILPVAADSRILRVAREDRIVKVTS